MTIMVGAARRPARWSALCTLAAMALLLSAGSASAFFQSANVVVTVDKTGYHVGDTVNVTMRVFSFATLADPVSITLRLNPGTSGSRLVNVSRQSVGTYNATFQIGSADVGSSNPYLTGQILLQVSAGFPTLTDVEYALVDVLPQDVLGLTVTPSAFEAAPGNSVPVSLELTANGLPRDADSLSVTALVSSGDLNSELLNVPVANVSTGNYSADVSIPAGLIPPGQVLVTAEANVSGASVRRSVYIAVPGSQPFEVWSYLSAFTPPTVQFTIFVGDSAGGFVGGADVSLNYSSTSSSPGGASVNGSATATTDAFGQAAFNLYLDGAYDALAVTYRGNVTRGADRQAFSGVLAAPTFSAASFEIVRTNPYEIPVANATAVLNYTVRAAGRSVAGASVYYYAQNNVEFVGAGNVTSDANGDFTLALRVPAGGLRILLASKTGTSWYQTTDFVLPYGRLEVTTTEVRVGGVVRVNLTLPYPATWYTGASVAPYTPAGGQSPWLDVSGFFGAGTPYHTGSQVTYALSLPKFLPKDTDYLVHAVAIPASLFTSGAPPGAYAYSRLVHITNVPAQVQANLSTRSAVVGANVQVNASSSYDPDGYIVGYRVDWGDGNSSDWGGSPFLSHVYASPGDYRVSVAVKDDSGAVSVTQTDLHVEGTIFGLRSSIAIPLFAGLGAVAAAVILFVWWRRRRTAPKPSPPESAQKSSAEPSQQDQGRS